MISVVDPTSSKVFESSFRLERDSKIVLVVAAVALAVFATLMVVSVFVNPIPLVALVAVGAIAGSGLITGIALSRLKLKAKEPELKPKETGITDEGANKRIRDFFKKGWELNQSHLQSQHFVQIGDREKIPRDFTRLFAGGFKIPEGADKKAFQRLIIGNQIFANQEMINCLNPDEDPEKKAERFLDAAKKSLADQMPKKPKEVGYYSGILPYIFDIANWTLEVDRLEGEYSGTEDPDSIFYLLREKKSKGIPSFIPSEGDCDFMMQLDPKKHRMVIETLSCIDFSDGEELLIVERRLEGDLGKMLKGKKGNRLPLTDYHLKIRLGTKKEYQKMLSKKRLNSPVKDAGFIPIRFPSVLF